MWRIPFNRPRAGQTELDNVREAVSSGALAGNGPFAQRCTEWLESRCGAQRAILTGSCSAALELAALLCRIQPGDEVIMPSYTFVTTASSVVLRGGVPVFVDIRGDTLNIDERLIEPAITDRTKMIVPVHYGGVPCEMNAIMDIGVRHDLRVVEDAAQGILASYRGQPLGAIGDLGALSFHETKNIVCGEGGALLINDAALVERAEILQEKGTNRAEFLRGDAVKYSWVDLGSSFLLGELSAAFLAAQLERAEELHEARVRTWHQYHSAIEPLEERGLVRRPVVSSDDGHNAHMYFVLLAPGISRARVLDQLHAAGIEAVFHYVPLHSSPAGQRFGRAASAMIQTEDVSARLIRLPLWSGMTEDLVEDVVTTLDRAIGRA